jgi:transcriptional regulator with XRE-family HTH domain
MNKRVIEIRKFKGLTQNEFAEKLGFTQANLSAIELEKIPLTEANIRLICLTFGVNEEWLRFGNGDMMDDEAQLSEKERQLLAFFRQLSPKAREMLIEYAEKLAADEKALRGEAEKGEKLA